MAEVAFTGAALVLAQGKRGQTLVVDYHAVACLGSVAAGVSLAWAGRRRLAPRRDLVAWGTHQDVVIMVHHALQPYFQTHPLALKYASRLDVGRSIVGRRQYRW